MARHPHFADWYRPSGIAPSEEVLDKRWAGVEEAAGKATTLLLLELAALFTVPGRDESTVPNEFRQAFKNHDDDLSARGNLQELRILAGATLRFLIEQENTMSPLAALALTCGAFATREKAVPYSDHLRTANRFLVSHSRNIRESDTKAIGSLPSFSKAKFTETLPADLFAPNQLPQIHDPLLKTLVSMGADVSTTLKQFQSSINEITRGSRIHDEDIGMLWWVQTRFSRDLEKPFLEVGHVAATLLFPIELADLTRLPFPSAGATSLLAMALNLAGATSSQRVTIGNAVDALPSDWRTQVCAKDIATPVATLSPLLGAIRRSVDSGLAADWVSMFRNDCEIPTDQPFPLLYVAVQLYRERMLSRAYLEAKL
jgi:hypothetical protein